MNLLEDSYSVIASKANIQQAINQAQGHMQEALYVMADQLVLPPTQEAMRAFNNLSTLAERLSGKRYISEEFIGVTTGWSRAVIIPIEYDENGRPTTALYCTQQIKDEKEKELEHERQLKAAVKDAEEANAAKTSFLFNMSHDIRTPMNAIIGFTNLLRKHQEEADRREDYLNKIENSSKVLLSIINNVLEMARIEKGNILIEETHWSAEHFNDTLFSVFHEMMQEKGIEFTRTIDVQHHDVLCDSSKLREIFNNILSNAYKYTNPGGKVTMHLKEVEGPREGYAYYQTTIADSGIGMSKEFLPYLYDEFSRENNTTDNKIEGTGLGMPIVKRLVEMMQGTIAVSSQKGVGTTFVVTLPHKIAERKLVTQHNDVKLDPTLFTGKRILLAEDNELNAEIAMEILGEAGFIVEHVSDGLQCVKTLEEAADHYYNVILMDIQMPNMNGYEATRAIRKLPDSAKAHTPILAMTANAFEEDKREAMNAGMDGHLAKPINVNELMMTLARFI